MRNLARMLAFDVAAPAAVVGALVMIGVMLGWPLWWVSVCSILCLLVVQAVLVNAVLYRRDSVTLGTDDDTPGLRLAVVGVTTAAVAAAAVIGYTRWTVPDRQFTADTSEVVGLASEVAEATATFDPSAPNLALDRATAAMTPDRAEAFKGQFSSATADMTKRRVTAQAKTISAGLETLTPSAATVAVLMRATQTEPGQQPDSAVLALRVALAKQDGRWLVADVAPINAR